jgi:hypothetical protein
LLSLSSQRISEILGEEERSIHHTTRMGAVLQLAPNKNHTSNAKVSSVQINCNPCKLYAKKTFFQRERERERDTSRTDWEAM